MATDPDPGPISKLSLEGRITMPEHKDIPTISTSEASTAPPSANGMNATAPSSAPGHATSWADEVNSPADANKPAVEESDLAKGTQSIVNFKAHLTMGILTPNSTAQTDGATESQNGR